MTSAMSAFASPSTTSPSALLSGLAGLAGLSSETRLYDL
ncbi:MAG: hypothetical protein H6R19_3484, partial [Proteobacteria bacterium]|nr:hypothetical protein [Pseudomonadota bacterium]